MLDGEADRAQIAGSARLGARWPRLLAVAPALARPRPRRRAPAALRSHRGPRRRPHPAAPTGDRASDAGRRRVPRRLGERAEGRARPGPGTAAARCGPAPTSAPTASSSSSTGRPPGTRCSYVDEVIQDGSGADARRARWSPAAGAAAPPCLRRRRAGHLLPAGRRGRCRRCRGYPTAAVGRCSPAASRATRRIGVGVRARLPFRVWVEDGVADPSCGGGAPLVLTARCAQDGAVADEPEGGDPVCWLERLCPQCRRHAHSRHRRVLALRSPARLRPDAQLGPDARGVELTARTSWPGGRVTGCPSGPVPRKVRTPQGRVVVNGNPG